MVYIFFIKMFIIFYYFFLEIAIVNKSVMTIMMRLLRVNFLFFLVIHLFWLLLLTFFLHEWRLRIKVLLNWLLFLFFRLFFWNCFLPILSSIIYFLLRGHSVLLTIVALTLIASISTTTTCWFLHFLLIVLLRFWHFNFIKPLLVFFWDLNMSLFIMNSWLLN